jgi:dephospho-CoA kinase
MLRVGLTGGLGSGKSTVAAMLAARGAHVLSADEIGRELMQPDTAVSTAIAHHFGPQVVLPDGSLDRRELARLAFAEGRVEELNAIVHPATIARQQELAASIALADSHAILIVESALIFETNYGKAGASPWRERFDRLILVTAPEETKVARFVARSGAGDSPAMAAEARRRLARMIPDADKVPLCDFVIANDGGLPALEAQVEAVWAALCAAS